MGIYDVLKDVVDSLKPEHLDGFRAALQVAAGLLDGLRVALRLAPKHLGTPHR